MRQSTLVVLLGVLVLTGCRHAPAFWSAEHTAADTLRTTAQGQVLGGEGRYGSHAWLGVPFAAPPVGPLRWKKPQPPQPWSGVREATHFGHVCPQPGSPLAGSEAGSLVGDEDCLTVSLWAPPMTPAQVPSSKLPVMVWIHGGGNSIGTAAFYDGGKLAVEQGVLVVMVQYRLGPLGWFRHASLREGADPLDASGNFGTLDLVRSLEWVRENAAAFGGDPGNVTIFGESAGGLNTYTLLLAPQAKGLFHKAIVESGGTWAETPERAENFAAAGGHPFSSNEVIAKLLVAQGRATTEADARVQVTSTPPGELANWLRSVPAKALFEAYQSSRGLGMLDAPLVFGDGAVLPAGDWLSAFSSGAWNQVPVIAGTNHDEMRLFLFLDPRFSHRVLGIFPRLNDEAAYVATADVMSAFWKLSGVDQPLLAMRESGARDVWAYRFDWNDEPKKLGADLKVMLGAAHGVEIPFVFGHFEMGPLNVLFTEQNAEGREFVSKAMRAAWGSFARSGRPSPEWTVFDPAGPTHLVFDVPAKGGVRMEHTLEDRAALLQTLMGTESLTLEQRCEAFRDLTKRGRGLTKDDYAKEARCAAWPQK